MYIKDLTAQTLGNVLKAMKKTDIMCPQQMNQLGNNLIVTMGGLCSVRKKLYKLNKNEIIS